MSEGLAFEGVSVRLGGRPIAALDAVVAPGEALTVMGRSGSGKSTLLAAAAGSLAPELELRGRIRLDGRDVTRLPTERRRIGILFQDELLFPHLSVGGNLGFGLPAGLRRAERRARIEAALESVGLGGMAGRDPATLSGGQRARAALMRALLAAPRALLLDEPFSKLDAPLRAQVRALVFGLARERGLPVLLVTHDPADAEAAGGRVATLGE